MGGGAVGISGAARPAWSVLIDAIEALSGASTMEQVIEIVRRRAREISGADGITFVLRDGDRCFYVDEDAIGPLWKGQKFPMTSCISGWAMLNKRAAIVPDIYLDARIPHDVYRPTFVKSLMMVPVRIEDPLAAIGAYWAHEHEPDAQEAELLQNLARATATAIANVTLQTSLRNAAEQATAQAAEIGRLYDETVRENAERRKAEEQLRQAQKMEAIGNLTGGMAHDFNNLLGIVIGNLDLMVAGTDLGEQTRQMSGEALDAAIRGADLIRRLLAFARRQPVQPKLLRINELIRGIGTLLGRTLGERVKLTLELSEQAWPIIVDPAQLEASIVNLANNARDAMPNGGRLAIATANRTVDEDSAEQLGTITPGDYVVVEVADNGSGMPPDVAARIFEPFFTTKEKGRGTGLGLAMVSAFVEQTGGRIGLYTEPGKGTVFRLYLPRAASEEIESEAALPVMIPGGTETVLVVEDNEQLRRVAMRALSGLGYRVLEAADADAASRSLEAGPVDLLFTDLVIPGRVKGRDFAADALVRHPGLKILLTSGFPDTVLDAAERPNGWRLLTKPYRREELARAVRDTLDGTA
ncbi:MAG TPA: ATP-binding protein [Aliidongia sp.]|nr:ATP-binding protein [Aliidongia sp.]